MRLELHRGKGSGGTAVFHSTKVYLHTGTREKETYAPNRNLRKLSAAILVLVMSADVPGDPPVHKKMVAARRKRMLVI
jgi:hypothetical protein